MADRLRVTVNFKSLSSIGRNEEEARKILSAAQADKANRKVIYDYRNGVYCIMPVEPTESFEGEFVLQLYTNYINYLNECSSEWVSSGYLDMGLIPISIAPSFIGTKVDEILLPIVKGWDCKIYWLPATSFLNYNYGSRSKDIWIKKEDFARILNVPMEQARLSTFLNAIWVMNTSK